MAGLKKKIMAEQKRLIAGIILLALTFLSITSLFSDSTGILGDILKRMFLSLAGILRFCLPWFLFLLSGFLLLVKKRKEIQQIAIISGSVFLLAAVVCHFSLPLEGYSFAQALQNAYRTGEGAGLLGALPAMCLMTVLGRLGSYLFLFTAVLIFVVLYFQINLEEWLLRLKEYKPTFQKSQPLIFKKKEKSQAKKAKEKLDETEPLEVVPSIQPVVNRSKPVEPTVLEEKTVIKTQLQEAYQLPSPALLVANLKGNAGLDHKELKENIRILEETLASFGVNAKVVEVQQGPTITRYELQPPAGVKVSKIVNLTDDISLALAASGVRIEAPVPGKAVVGIEVPNKKTTMVCLREILMNDKFQNAQSKLSVGFGQDIAGNPIIGDLIKMPHLLVAGTTGSGKSVCINTIITSILYKASPDEVKFLLIDPKMVELVSYNGIPHLISPVVTQPKKAAGALKWAVQEMERRYQLFAEHGVRNLEAFNKGETPLPYIVIIIDELADLMLVAANDVEDAICRLAQMARAAGLHLVIATQRPSVDVITGVIKSNISSRIAFAVSSQVDSRTILDMGGAEKLLGKGDMLFSPIGSLRPVRVQGAFISDKEVEGIVHFLREQGISSAEEEITITEVSGAKKEDSGEMDTLFYEAVRVILEGKQASTSMLQRRLRIGYARAGRLMDLLEEKGIVGPYEGSKPRTILVNADFLKERNSGEA